MFGRISIMIIFCMLWASVNLLAQRGANDTIRMGAIVIDNDTLPHLWLRDAYCYGKGNKDLVRKRREAREQREAYDRLRYNVYKVYPYAVAAGFIMHDIDSAMASLYSKDAKKIYKQRKEDELNKKFKGELVNLTMSQGQVLVKLIARQTGKPCYQIIKDLKGGLNARIWQTVAILFDNNLKNNYDPLGEDEAMESIVLEIERSGHFEMKR